MIRNVIFDWSGTLVDDLSAVWRSTNYTLEQAGQPVMSREKFRSEFSLPFDEFYQRVTPGVPLEQLEEWYKASFEEEQKQIVPLPHAVEFFGFCQQQQMRTFLLSSIHPDHYHAQSSRIQFAFDRTYLRVMDKRAQMGELLSENDLDPSETVFIGDMQHDVDAARAGGIHSCVVLTGYNTLAQLRESRPELIVEHLGELKKILIQNQLEWPAAGSNHRQPVSTVGALIYNHDGQVLLVQTRKWYDRWGIPGGKIEFGESSEDALRRELKEETNLEVEDIRFALVQDCIQSDEFYRNEHFLLLNYTCTATDDAAVKLNDEAQAHQWVSPAAAMALDLNGPTRHLLESVNGP
jgi:phosphoglycolate phosphatase-like HAD superfamily hydrolase/ADP-ribose pyrophosphatase YjhB (NUDIX family)